MPMTTTTVSTRTTSSTAVHEISFRGLAGAIFILLCAAAVLYVIGFATNAWRIENNYHEGLWESCTCHPKKIVEDWFRATQAMITIGLIGLIFSLVLAVVYLCVHSISKNTTILALIIACFISVMFMLVGFIIYGVKSYGLNWSFVLSVVASIMCLIAGILGIVQMRQSGVRI